MGGYSNPFDAPLQSELQEHQASQKATQTSSPIGNPFDEPLLSEKLETQQQSAGQVTNDVGNTVIVPKDGESFQDTINRAVQRSKSLTPQQGQSEIDKEATTIPKKTAQTLGAAATIGAVGPALLAMPGEVADFAIKHLAGNVLPGMEGEAAKQVLSQAVPKVIQFAETMGKLGIGAGGVGYLIKNLMGDGKK